MSILKEARKDSIERVGENIRIDIANKDEAAKLLTTLVEAGSDVYHFKVDHKSLESIFLHITQNQ